MQAPNPSTVRCELVTDVKPERSAVSRVVVNANKRVFEALVQSGACDSLVTEGAERPLRELRARLFATIDGACDHGNRVRERFAAKVLPFFSEHLDAGKR